VSLPNFMHRLVVCTGFGFRQAIASAIDPHFYSDDGAAAQDWLSRIAQPMVPSKPEWRFPQLHIREKAVDAARFTTSLNQMVHGFVAGNLIVGSVMAVATTLVL
jgi:hypothetical protein